MADCEIRIASKSARRNVPVENSIADIAGNVDYQINVDSDSLLDNEITKEMIRAPHQKGEIVDPLAMDPVPIWLYMVNASLFIGSRD